MLGEGEEDVLNSPNLIDYALGSPQLLTKFVNSLKEVGSWTIRTNFLHGKYFRLTGFSQV